MKNLRNSVRLIGHLGTDAEVKTGKSEQPFLICKLATNDVVKREGETIKQTQWHTVLFFGKTAERGTPYLKKGVQVMIEGKLVYRQWTNKEGETKYTTEIIGEDFLLVSSKKVASSVEEEMA
jgi:single-strand DNA-binding protein